MCKLRTLAVMALVVGALNGMAGAMTIDVTQTPYNAVPDDGIDDTAAIQAAINALPHGGTVFFPIGVYDISGDGLYHNDPGPQGTPGAEKPVTFQGESLLMADTSYWRGSILRRTTTGRILTLNPGRGWANSKIEISHLGFRGDPGVQVTAIDGYRTRLTVRSCEFCYCYNGIYLDNTGTYGVDYSDMNFLEHLRFDDCFGGDLIRIRGADASVINGVYADNANYNGQRATGIHLISTMTASISSVLVNHCASILQLDWCQGISVRGVYSEGCDRALNACASHGISIDGFMVKTSSETVKFNLTASDNDNTTNVKISNGSIYQVTGTGYDIWSNGDGTMIVENVLCYTGGYDTVAPRPLRWETINSAVLARYGAKKSDLAGYFTGMGGWPADIPFLLLKDGAASVFRVESTGETTAAKYIFPNGVQVLSGSGSTQATLPAGLPNGSFYLSTNGNMYIRTSGGWKKASLTSVP